MIGKNDQCPDTRLKLGYPFLDRRRLQGRFSTPRNILSLIMSCGYHFQEVINPHVGFLFNICERTANLVVLQWF